MFDKHVHVWGGGSQNHYHRAEVHEHRAPTDASVKLLKEMEEKAEAKLLGSVRLEGCEVSCVVHHMQDAMNLDHKFIIRYRLGGVTRDVRHTFMTRASGSEYEEKRRMASELLEVLSQDIAATILAPAMDKALPRL